MFIIKVEEREKKVAYIKINEIYQRTVNILRNYNLISDEEFLPRTRIKSIFLAKRRRWLFSMSFVLSGNELELSNCYRSLIKIGVRKLDEVSNVSLSGLNLKILEAYNNAKELLRRALKKYARVEIK